MKKITKNSMLIIVIALAIASCTKYDTGINGVANTANAGAANSTLTNRVTVGFVVNASTLPSVPASVLAPSTTFRRFLSYDTSKRAGFFADTVPVYKAGDVINIVAFLKGDDYAISQRRINVGLYKAPGAWITTTPATNINVMQNAEDRYRSYQPGAQTGVQPANAVSPLVPNAPIFSAVADTILTLPSIVPFNTTPFTVTQVANELVGGINYNTYLVQLSFKIPATYGNKFVSGNVMSINFNVGAPFGFLFQAENASNINWIYAFRIR